MLRSGLCAAWTFANQPPASNHATWPSVLPLPALPGQHTCQRHVFLRPCRAPHCRHLPASAYPGDPLQTSLPGSESGLRRDPCPSCWKSILQRVLVPAKMPGSSLPTSAALRAHSLHASQRHALQRAGQHRRNAPTPKTQKHAARPAPAPRVSPGGRLTSGRERRDHHLSAPRTGLLSALALPTSNVCAYVRRRGLWQRFIAINCHTSFTATATAPRLTMAGDSLHKLLRGPGRGLG